MHEDTWDASDVERPILNGEAPIEELQRAAEAGEFEGAPGELREHLRNLGVIE